MQADPSMGPHAEYGAAQCVMTPGFGLEQKSAILLTLEQLHNSIAQEKRRSVAAETCSAKSTLKINNKQLDKNETTK